MTKIPNRILSHRKRSALSQDELAFLLGVHGGAKVCRYERFASVPSLETALACEAVLGRPAKELFAGLYRRIEREVAARAKALIHRADRGKPGRNSARRRKVLARIAASLAKTTQSYE